MTQIASVEVVRVSDSVLFSLFQEMKDATDESKIYIQLVGQNTPSEAPKQLDVSGSSFAINSIEIRVAYIVIRLMRQFGRNAQSHFLLNDKLDFYFTDPQQHNRQVHEDLKNYETFIKLYDIALSRLVPFASVRELQSSSEDAGSLRALAESHAARLQQLQEHSTKHVAELDSIIVRRLDDLTARYDKRQNDLDERYAEKEKALQQRSLELDDRLKEVDVRQNTIVRRKIREDMASRIVSGASIFKPSKDTLQLRRPIAIVSIGFISLLTGLNLFFIYELSRTGFSSFLDYFPLLIKQSFAALSLTGFIIYYIRFQSRWFERQSTAEMALTQFQFDFERASWLVETALEWQQQGKDMPEALVKSLSRNLFVQENGPPDDDEIRPADIVASALVGRAGKVKVNLPGVEAEFDGAKLNKPVQVPRAPS